jgi:hypothetical protein
LDDKVNVACNAKKTVSFETIEKKAETTGLEGSEQPATPDDAAPGDASPSRPGAGGNDDTTQEIVARPTTPAAPPTNIVVSQDRIGPGS